MSGEVEFRKNPITQRTWADKANHAALDNGYDNCPLCCVWVQLKNLVSAVEGLHIP